MVSPHQITMIPFTVEVFNQIPTLEASNEALQQSSQTTLSNFRDLLVHYKQNDNFGFSLLHRHFPLKQSQILVELNNVTTPWTVSEADIAYLQSNGFTRYKTGIIHPTSWAFVTLPVGNLGLMPYEFAYIEGGIEKDAARLHDSSYAELLSAASTLLQSLQLQRHIAVTLLPDVDIDGAVETTVGEANILRLRGEHNVASPFHASDCQHSHDIQASYFWPTGENGKVRAKAKGSKCDSMDTCKCTVKDAPLTEHTHEIQASFFWPTGEDGKVPLKAKGSKCDSWCWNTVKDSDDSSRIGGAWWTLHSGAEATTYLS